MYPRVLKTFWLLTTLTLGVGSITLTYHEDIATFEIATQTCSGTSGGRLAGLEDIENQDVGFWESENFWKTSTNNKEPFWISPKRDVPCVYVCQLGDEKITCLLTPYEDEAYPYICATGNPPNLNSRKKWNEKTLPVVELEENNKKCLSQSSTRQERSAQVPGKVNQPETGVSEKINVSPQIPTNIYNSTSIQDGDDIYIFVYNKRSPKEINRICKEIYKARIIGSNNNAVQLIKNISDDCDLSFTSYTDGPFENVTLGIDGYYCNISSPKCFHKNQRGNDSFICIVKEQAFSCDSKKTSTCSGSARFKKLMCGIVIGTTTKEPVSSPPPSSVSSTTSIRSSTRTTKTIDDRLTTNKPVSSGTSSLDPSLNTTSELSPNAPTNSSGVVLTIVLVVSAILILILVPVLVLLYKRRKKNMGNVSHGIPNNQNNNIRGQSTATYDEIEEGPMGAESRAFLSTNQNIAQNSDNYDLTRPVPDATNGPESRHYFLLTPTKPPEENIYQRANFASSKDNTINNGRVSSATDDGDYDHLHEHLRERTVQQQHASEIYHQANFKIKTDGNPADRETGEYQHLHEVCEKDGQKSVWGEYETCTVINATLK